jgi:hypothetical protein
MTAMLTFYPELTLLDRCDRCGCQARARAVFHNCAELLFCGHHYRKHKNRLLETATVVLLSP